MCATEERVETLAEDVEPYFLHAQLAQACLGLGDDRLLGREWAQFTWQLRANGELRSEVELAQVLLGLRIQGRGVNLADEVLAFDKCVDPWLDVVGRVGALVLGPEAGAED